MANLGGHLGALSNDRNLLRFVVQARSTGKQLGIGSYGVVEEVFMIMSEKLSLSHNLTHHTPSFQVEVDGLVCAGKKIHETLLDIGNVGVRDIAAKYVQECQLMSDLRHPNIIQFLGVCFLPNCQLPSLVMEKLDGNLDDLQPRLHTLIQIKLNQFKLRLHTNA